MRKSCWVGVTLALFTVIVFSIGGGTIAQANCDDPFADSGTLRFPVTFWEKTDFCHHSVPYNEIRSGGPPPDGIPPIYEPEFEFD